MTSPLCFSSITQVRSSSPTFIFSVITRRVAATLGCGAHSRYLVTSGSRAILWNSAPASSSTGGRSTIRCPAMRAGGYSAMVSEAERLIGAADELGLRGAEFRQRRVARDGRGGVYGQVGQILDQIQQDQVGGRVGLPPRPVGAGPAERSGAARPEQRDGLRRGGHHRQIQP